MRIVGIGGEPASGKTYFMCRIMREFGRHDKGGLVKDGPLSYHQYECVDALILGKYLKGDKFAGTDRLSMSIQPRALQFLSYLRSTVPDSFTVFFEGDRLFNASFLSECERLVGQSNCAWLMLYANERTLAHRHKKRQDTQGATFLKGRRTKMSNLACKFEIFRLCSDAGSNYLPRSVNAILHHVSVESSKYVSFRLDLYHELYTGVRRGRD